MADILNLSFGCGNTLLAYQLNQIVDAINRIYNIQSESNEDYIPISGSDDISGNLIPDGSDNYNLGTKNNYWKDIYTSTEHTKILKFHSQQLTYESLGELYVGKDTSNNNETILHFKHGNNNEEIVATRDWVNSLLNPTRINIGSTGSISEELYNDESNYIKIESSSDNPIVIAGYDENTLPSGIKFGDASTGDVLTVYNGKIYVNGDIFGGENGVSVLNDLSNVNASAPTTGDFLMYNGIRWVNSPLPESLIIHPSDVSRNEEYYLMYEETDEHPSGQYSWVERPPGANELNELDDVEIDYTKLELGQVLVYSQVTDEENNTYNSWVNKTLSGSLTYNQSDRDKYLRVNSNGDGTEWSDISLSDLSNTEIGGLGNALSNGLVLVYDSSLSNWKNTSLPANLPSGGINGDHLIMGSNGPEWETSYNIYLVENGNKTLNGTITPHSTSNGGGIFIGTNKSGNIYSSLANPIILSPGTGGVQIANSGTGNNYVSTIKTSNDGNLILKSSVDTIIDTELGNQYIYLNGSRIYLSTDTSTNGHYLSLNNNNLLCYDGNIIGSGGGLTAATAGGLNIVATGTTTAAIPVADNNHYGVIKIDSDASLGTNQYPVELSSGVAYVEVPATSLTSVTWNNVSDKPSWIGSSKPSYTASEVGALPSSTTWGLSISGNDLTISKGSGSSLVTLPTGGSSSETFFFLFISLLKNRYNSKMIITQTQNSSHTAVTSIGLITEPTFIEEDVLYMLKGYFQSGGLYFINPLFRFNKNGSDYYLLVVVDNVSSPELVYCCVDGFNDDDAVYGYGTDSRTITNSKEVVYNISRYMINLLQTKYNITVSNSNGGYTASSDYMYSYSSTIQTVTTSNVKYYIEPNAASGQYNTIDVSI